MDGRRVLPAMLLLVLLPLAGCLDTGSGPMGPAPSVTSGDAAPQADPTSSPDEGRCLDRLDGAGRVVVAVTYTSGLGPDGAIRGPWRDVTVVAADDGRRLSARNETDADGCTELFLPVQGEYRFHVAVEQMGGCSPSGSARNATWDGSDLLVRLHYSDPCA